MFWNRILKPDLICIHSKCAHSESEFKFPSTCCSKISANFNRTDVCTFEQAENDNAEGCLDQAFRFMDHSYAIVAGIASAVIVTELLGIRCALVLHNSIGSGSCSQSTVSNVAEKGQVAELSKMDAWRTNSRQKIGKEVEVTIQKPSKRIKNNSLKIPKEVEVSKLKPSKPPSAVSNKSFEFPPPPDFSTKKETYEAINKPLI